MRKLMWFTVGFAAACAVCAYLFAGNLMYVIAGLSFIGGILLLVGEPLFSKQKIVAMLLMGYAAGAFWYQYCLDTTIGQAEMLDGSTVNVTFVAADYSYDVEFGTAVEGTVEVEEHTYKVRLYLNHSVDIVPGDRITANFDFDVCTPQWDGDRAYFSAEGIRFLLYGTDEIEVCSDEQTSFRYLPAIWRKKITDQIALLFPGDTMGFAKALILGDTSDLSYRSDTDLKQSGLRHVAAVSGLHVSILFGFLYVLMGKRRRLTSVVIFPVLLLFAAVSGFSASVVRACIMHLMMQIAYLTKREPDDRTALSVAVLTLLVVNPQCVMSVGLQLSVASVVGILLFSKGITEWINRWKLWGSIKKGSFKKRAVEWFASGVSLSLSASAFTLPLTAVYFGTVSLMGVIANLLCLWMIHAVFCGIVFACVVGSFWALGGKILAVGISWLIRYVLWVAKILAAFPLSTLYMDSPYVVAWVILTAVLVILFASNRILKLRYTAGMVCFSLILAIGASWIEPRLGAFRVSILDVGQGQSVLIQAEGKNYLVDCGGSVDRRVADSVSGYLASCGVFRLDGLILTHYDKDHVGAVPYLLQRVEAETLYLPADRSSEFETKILSRHSGVVQRVQEDLAIPLGDGLIQIFATSGAESDNESSLCILFQKADYDILITGDRGALGEMALILEEKLPQTEVLVVGHHGASGSTSELLLQTLQPQLAVISVGTDNPYGHPSTQVLERLKEHGCEVRRTDIEGTIVLVG